MTYHLPRQPSTPRIAVWRKVKLLGVAQLAHGLVALPRDACTQEQLEWVAEEVVERARRPRCGWPSRDRRRRGGRFAARLTEERAAEYQAVMALVWVALPEIARRLPGGKSRRTNSASRTYLRHPLVRRLACE